MRLTAPLRAGLFFSSQRRTANHYASLPRLCPRMDGMSRAQDAQERPAWERSFRTLRFRHVTRSVMNGIVRRIPAPHPCGAEATNRSRRFVPTRSVGTIRTANHYHHALLSGACPRKDTSLQHHVTRLLHLHCSTRLTGISLSTNNLSYQTDIDHDIAQTAVAILLVLKMGL